MSLIMLLSKPPDITEMTSLALSLSLTKKMSSSHSSYPKLMNSLPLIARPMAYGGKRLVFAAHFTSSHSMLKDHTQ